MELFKKYFSDVSNWEAEEVKCICPFHNDSKPSASINTEKNLFHCWVCDLGLNEEQFVAKVNGITTAEAIKLLEKYKTNDELDNYIANLWADSKFLKKVYDLGLSDETIENFKLGSVKDDVSGRKTLGIPVLYNNLLVDVRRYNLLKHEGMNKVVSSGDRVGWVIPYDTFTKSNEPCYFFEGEKDMLIAHEQGINAYTLTGGAGSRPNEYTIGAFKDKDIILCYDNDDAGRKGMIEMFKKIKDIANTVRYIDISEVVKEEKEDFYDFVMKYNGDIFDFFALEHKYFDLVEIEKDTNISIKKALKNNKLRKSLKSTVTITSEFSDPYSVPTIVEFEKGEELNPDKEKLFKGEVKTWFLETDNMVKMLELIEASAKDSEVNSKLKSFVGIPAKEPNITIRKRELKTVYKATAVDKDFDGAVTSLDLYSFDKLDVGGQYVIEYKIYPHPTKHQKLVAVCSSSVTMHDNRNYLVNKNHLNEFIVKGTVEERLNFLYHSAKHHIAKHLDYNLWLMSDLVFNSVLDFTYGETMRGALDVFFLGDTQVGKSETTSKMVELYNFGHFLSLKTSTTVGLIGGSNKVDGAYCNTIGAIPRQHKRLAILEEFSGAKHDFIKTMTDIRSSNELRLSRVSGELVVPCKLRMISISNPLNDENGNPRFLNTFPNGIMPLMELIKSAEDVARYDGFLLIPKIEKRFNPFDYKVEGVAIPKEAYANKINWVATRQPENVIFEKGVDSYIWEKAEILNERFECNFPLFGTTTSKKLARFCVALAALIVNVDETYENIIVNKEIVDYVCDYLVGIYDNNVFKLGEYAKEFKEYNECTAKDIKELEKLYAKNSTLLSFLNGLSKTSRSNLSSVSGMDNSKFAPIFNKLVAMKFIRLNMDTIYPTDKFRKTFNKINKNIATDSGNMIESYSGGSCGVTFINDLEDGVGNDS